MSYVLLEVNAQILYKSILF